MQEFNIKVEMKAISSSVTAKALEDIKLSVAQLFKEKLNTEAFVGNVQITHIKASADRKQGEYVRRQNDPVTNREGYYKEI